MGSNGSFLQPSVQQSEAVADHFGRKVLFVVELGKIIGNLFEFGCSEGADHANLIENMSAKFQIPFQQFLVLLILFGKAIGISDISDQIRNKIDSQVVLDHQEGLLVDELGIEGKIFDKIFDISEDLYFQLRRMYFTWK